jgi:hypothetical protein
LQSLVKKVRIFARVEAEAVIREVDPREQIRLGCRRCGRARAGARREGSGRSDEAAGGEEGTAIHGFSRSGAWVVETTRAPAGALEVSPMPRVS